MACAAPAWKMRFVERLLWNSRQEFDVECPTAEGFFQRVEDHQKPILLVDSGDITSAGGAGDSTEILRSCLQQGLALRTVIPLVDPATVARAFVIGRGSRGRFGVGGQDAAGYNQRVAVDARVLQLDSQPVRIKGPSFAGMSLDMGRRALLEIEPHINLLVAEYASFTHDPQTLRSMGLEPRACDIIVQKSHKLFRAAYADMAGSVVALDTPGYTDRNIRRLPFRRLPKDIYPFVGG